MAADAQNYTAALAYLKEKKYVAAQKKLLEIAKKNPNYRNVMYFLAKSYYYDHQEKKAQKCLLTYLKQTHIKKEFASYKLLVKIALKQKQFDLARYYLTKAQKIAPDKQSLTKLTALLAKQSQPKKLQLKMKFQSLAKNKTPIAITTHPKWQKQKFLLNGLSDYQKKVFAKGGWYEFSLIKIQPSSIKGFMTAVVVDERKYYAKYLPKLPFNYLRTAFNDYLEEERFFRQKWAKSRVFSLLVVPGFKRQNIASLLELNGLLDDQAKRHLQGCEDLVVLKKMGETLPLAQQDKLVELDALYDFGYLCRKNCRDTLHLYQKCQAEQLLLKMLAQKSRHKLPLKKKFNFNPTPEQKAFVNWLVKQENSVLGLLGVGGSGKTYTLGKILDATQVLALAPTHKARLNLVNCGFKQSETVQKLLYEIQQGQDPLKNCAARVILIDEVSMITLEMLTELMKYTGNSVRYLLIGDDRQLAPVFQDEEALAVCGNVMELLQEHGKYFYFKVNMRCKNAQLRPLIQACRDADMATLQRLEVYQSDVRSMLNYKYQHQSSERCMILAYKNATVAAVNRKFYEVLSKDKPCRVEFYEKNGYGRGGYFVGAQVVFYRNDDQKQKYGYTNSEFGVITRLVLPNKRCEQGLVVVKTQAATYHLPLEKAKEDLLLAYALTIHKSQGSGSDRVYVIEAYDRGLGYTAVSRARRELYFVKMTKEDLLKSIARPAQVKHNIY